MIPWFLYGLTARDRAGPTIRLVHEQNYTIANQVTITWTYTVPDDQLLFIASANVFAFSGTTVFQSGQLTLTDGIDPRYQSIRVPWQNQPNANGLGHVNWDGAPLVVVPGNLDVLLQATFSAAAVTNQATFALGGFLIPKGDIAPL